MTFKTTRHFFNFLITFLLLASFNNSKAQNITENFDDITTLAGNGWVMINNSSPVGQAWQQGTTAASGRFDAQNGTANSYISANYLSVATYGTISNWLISPNRTFRNGDVITFYTRKPAGNDYPDRLQVRLSTNGASTNVGATATSTGDFTTLLLEVNPTLITGVYPQTWTMYTITIAGLPAPTSGRIAFRYFVTAAGSSGVNSDYIGIDAFTYTQYVCPAITLSPGSGALTGGRAGTAYNLTLSQTGCLGAPSFAIVAGALPPGLTLSSSGIISGTPTATGTFNFTAMAGDASGCSGSSAYSITTICPQNPITFAPEDICGIGAPVILSAIPAGGTFSGTGVNSEQFDPSVGTQAITYDYTDPYGCAHASTTIFTVTDLGTGSVTPATQTICSGKPLVPITVSNTNPGIQYTLMSFEDGLVDNGNGTISGTLHNTSNEQQTVNLIWMAQVGSCSTSVTSTVLVNPLPQATVANNVSVDAPLNSCSAVATYTATLLGDPAPVVTYTFSGATTGSGNGTGSGSTFNGGVTEVTLTATNSCGSTDFTFSVIVNDTQKPTISCPAAVTVSCAGDVPSVDISSVTATDNCSGVTVTHVSDVISNQTCANRYTITRTYRATDAKGNTATCSQIITVNDQTAPVIACPANITTTNAGSCSGKTVDFTVNATDNCGGTVTVTTQPVSGSLFPLGTTTVTATATDVCGNVSTCTFTVTVTDVQTPAITAQPVNRAVCPGQDAVFSITASNIVSYQWQQQEGNNWVNIQGATNSSYTVANVTELLSGGHYRVALTGACTNLNSESVSLSIKAAPQPNITTAPELCVETKTIELTATPTGGVFSGTGVTDNKWNLEIPSLGNNTISYTYTDAEGCSASTSKQIILKLCDSSNTVSVITGYPNPTNGRLSLRALVTVEGNYTIVANDFNGRPVLRKNVHMQRGWNLFELSLSGQKAGLYVIKIGSGKKNGEVKVLKID